MRRILCLHLPRWRVQRLCVADHGLDPSRPIILHLRDARRGRMVVTFNAAAGKQGVRVGMSLAEAASLISRHDNCCILPADDMADRAALADLAEHCERFSPLVGWETVGQRALNSPTAGRAGSPDCLFLDVTGIGAVFGNEETLAREVIADVNRLGYAARVAIADTVGGAWAFASAGVTAVESRQEWARAEDCPWQILLPGSLNTAASHLPASALRVPAETVELLARLGVTSLEQLLALPRTALRARFGEHLQVRLDQLLGVASETIVAYRPPPEFVAERRLEYPAESRELVERVVDELLDCLARPLAERRQGAIRLVCRLDCLPGPPTLLQVGLFRPSANPHHLKELVRMRLEQTVLTGPVSRITVFASLTCPLENRQAELFGGNQREASRQEELLIDRLSNRLGRDVVLRPELTADPLPERAVRGVSLLDATSRTTSKSKPISPAHRPLWLYSPPRPVEVIAIAPDGPPSSLRLDGARRDVAFWWGPERIESGWWRGRGVRRDYYRVQLESGQRYWLFRRLQDSRWFLHGEFL